MSRATVWVLLKQRDRRPGDHPDPDPSLPLGVYASREALDRHVEKIGKTNSQYPMTSMGERAWRIGPEEDEGFFGNRAFYLYAMETKLRDGEMA